MILTARDNYYSRVKSNMKIDKNINEKSNIDQIGPVNIVTGCTSNIKQLTSATQIKVDSVTHNQNLNAAVITL